MNDHPSAVMLFAAGFGTRMGTLTKTRPKPLIEVAGTALIDHAIALARQIEPRVIVSNTHAHAGQMEAHLRQNGVIAAPEQPDILETGGGLKAALPQLGPGPVFTMNTDAIWSGPNPLHLLAEAWDPDTMDGLLMCVPTGQTLGHPGAGDFTLLPDGRVRRGPGLVYGGVQIIRTDGLTEIDQRAFSLNLLWDRMLQQDRLFALSYPGRWCDVGTPAGITLAETLIGECDG